VILGYVVQVFYKCPFLISRGYLNFDNILSDNFYPDQNRGFLLEGHSFAIVFPVKTNAAGLLTAIWEAIAPPGA